MNSPIQITDAATAQGNKTPKALYPKIATATFARLLLNTSRRFVYPFATVFSRHLGVSLTAITSLIAVNQFTAVLGIAVGPIIDRIGYRRVMLIGMAMLVIGMGWAGLSGSYLGLLVALILAGLAKTIYDPAVQAQIGKQVAFANRGAAIGFMEFAWSGSTLVGIPLVAMVLDRWGWRAPFFIFSILGMMSLILVGVIFEKDAGHQNTMTLRDFIAQFSRLGAKKVAVGAMVWAFLVSMANDNLFVVYGVWLETEFGMGIVALGLSTGLIGLAEMLAEGFTVFVGDRIGLKRSVSIGCLATILAYFGLPLTSSMASGALFGLFVLFLSFEFTMVTSICLATELLPEARATMMAAFYAAAGLGRVVGAAAGGIIWKNGGIWAVGLVSATGTALAAVVLLISLANWSHGVQTDD